MKWLINTLFLRPLLQVGTFIKRHPLLVVIAVLIMWLLGGLVATLVSVTGSIVAAVGKVFGDTAGAFAAKVATALINLVESSGRVFGLFLFVVSLFSPVLAAALGMWRLLDSFRPPLQGELVPTIGTGERPAARDPLIFGF